MYVKNPAQKVDGGRMTACVKHHIRFQYFLAAISNSFFLFAISAGGRDELLLFMGRW